MKYQVRVFVSLKPSILDPQGRTVERAVSHLGHDNVSGVRVGKLIEMVLEGERAAVEAQARELAGTVLSNPVMEDARVEIEELALQASV
ncbi:phosphoribosylformylglycinamidine synthase subunit PurS [Deinococcus peraridilitoris]|uniref:Phosphoribosylformylglycinamidine synthase subunit PurS n=1 Tax=Deinococcus peraridilitoris (strain DSM 19664 / LMG 22246 / CIP 109416 / KR-200) TaxID=937777 RepID=K9ZZD6_DEIPD|nr:phosphoribosylformylglycinamidine synthase subunit PurS [Deinococcus peraridilitoris]AFZ66292.1 phosphoribosylformylglycinamidine synthase, purS protein [Deinococcus peraridilitoris DSM 19664]